jgi:ribonuclease J
LKYDPTEKDFWFLLLGVTGEIGININLYEHNGQWQMIDFGVKFFTNHP